MNKIIQKIKNVLKAINKYLIKDTRYFFLYIFRYFQDGYKNNCDFYTDEEFIQLIKNGKSLIRFGDGEIILMHFQRIKYERYSDELRNDFIKIIKNYKNDSKYLILIPLFVNYTNKELKEKRSDLLRCWMPLKVTYELLFNKKAKYYDQHVFYKDRRFEKFIVPYMKTKQVVIVTNKQFIEVISKSKLADKNYLYVQCGDEDTYETRHEIQNDIINILDKNGVKKEDAIILMSAGLCKPIVYDMANMGYQILDVGRGLECYYTNFGIEFLI